jgi:putative endopeptidase
MRIAKGCALGALSASCLVAALAVAAPAPPSAAEEQQAIHADWIDEHVSPAADFYRYANGGWQAQNPIPPEYARWGVFDVTRRHTQDVVRGILERAANDPAAAPGSEEKKIGDFYASGMDEAAIEAAGAMPLAPELARIDAVAGPEDLEKAIAHLLTIGVEAGFSFGEMTDFHDSSRAIGAAFQGGFGLPDRAFYLDAAYASVLAEYKAHVGRVLQLVGEAADTADAHATAIVDFETRLAKASLPRSALRDPAAIDHPMDRAALAALTPDFSWSAFLADVGRPDVSSVNVGTPAFFGALDTELRTTPLDVFRAYFRARLAATFSPYLSRAFQDESFRMRSVLTGAKEMQPRWLRVLDAEDEALGFAVGHVYVDQAFPPSAKESAERLLDGVRAALRDDLATLSWMSPATREEALVKLRRMGDRIGYPEKWRDYGPFVVDRGPWVLDVLRGKAFEARRELDKIDRPVDRSEWAMTPQTVNAYYDPSTNEINFPAAILQPPFFDPAAPASVNFGGIGFVMGHEMTHGFDDEGAQFDASGNLRNWWTADDLARFHALTSCVADQFSKYDVEGVHLDGKLVVGEATADLGGLALAYRAYHASLGEEPAPDLAGFSPDQQFFLAAAHVWAQNVRPEELLLRATTDPHPPALWRVNGTVANMPEFQAAFRVPADSPMVNRNRCAIW